MRKQERLLFTKEKSDLISLRNKRIIFKDQMTTLDRSFLETWPEIKNKLNNKFKGRTPQWFKKLEADVQQYVLLATNTPLIY
ncbi:hypothetical protein RIR_jg39400.t1 [Rhizophagus irregularis DAOM 181602=DAOM 197198]|nr:hypothetical protein RIR_jg39400.t1 [Rhizophagus irregularis DAOM 181602=DAOM 197198]